MPNFVKVSRRINKFSIQGLSFDRSVCMAATCYSSPIMAVPLCKQLIGEEKKYTKCQIDISRTAGLVRVYII